MTTIYETRGVLAGAYKGRSPASLHTHTVVVQNNGGDYTGEQVLCSRVRPENLVDACAYNAAELQLAPSCPSCYARDPRFHEAR